MMLMRLGKELTGSRSKEGIGPIFAVRLNKIDK